MGAQKVGGNTENVANKRVGLEKGKTPTNPSYASDRRGETKIVE